jgi:hypothetical protein
MHLVDCFIELFAYTRYFLRNLEVSPPAYDDTVQRYGQLLDRAEGYARDGGFSQHDCHLALFATCAWIDELILCSGWKERDTWQLNQLQRIYFGTNNAGEEFYQLLTGLDPADREVREVFEYCLALGFKGRYFHSGDARRPVSRGLPHRPGRTEAPALEIFPIGISAAVPDSGGGVRRTVPDLSADPGPADCQIFRYRFLGDPDMDGSG